jgi:cellobiose-specific phosphotransferase system component IIB
MAVITSKNMLKWWGGVILTGYQLRYIYFIDPSVRERLTVPEIPFSRIDELGAGMYKGEKVTQAERHVDK